MDEQNRATLIGMLMEVDRICTKVGLSYQLAYGTALGAVRHKGMIPWDDDIDIMVIIDDYDRFCQTLRDLLPQSYCVYSADADHTYERLFARIALRELSRDEIYIDVYPMVGTQNSELGRWLLRIMCYVITRSFFIKRVRPWVNYRENPFKRTVAQLLKFILLPVPERVLMYQFTYLSKAFNVSQSETLYCLCGTYGRREMIPKEYISTSVCLEFEGQLLPVPANWHGYLTQMYGDYMVPRRRN